MKKCLNPDRGKEIPDTKKYCDEVCIKRHLEIKKEKFKKAYSESTKELEKTKDLVNEIGNNSIDLNEIYNFLDLNTAKDGRLNIKAEIMKKVIRLTSKWKSGDKNEWINLLANRTCVSTRKIREDYVQPLISEGILLETEQGFIQFMGLPRKGEISP